MQINLYATLRQIAGTKLVQIELDQPMRVNAVLDELLRRHPQLRAQLMDEGGQLNGHIHLFVNRKDITYLTDGLQALLQPGDTLDIFPPVGGGSKR